MTSPEETPPTWTEAVALEFYRRRDELIPMMPLREPPLPKTDQKHPGPVIEESSATGPGCESRPWKRRSGTSSGTLQWEKIHIGPATGT